MSDHSALRNVLEAVQRFGWTASGEQAERLARSLPESLGAVSPAKALGALLDGDFLARNEVTRAVAGAKLGAALARVDIQATSVDTDEVVVLFVTALEVEHSALEAHLRGARVVFGPEGGLYTLGRLSAAPEVRVGVVQAGAGNEAAAVETERAIRLLRPRIAIFAGVAGGLKGLALGTVVAATDVYDYAAVAEGSNGPKSRGKSAASSPKAVHAARLVARQGAWRSMRIEPASGWPDPSAPGALVKPIAAGPVLLKSTAGPTAALLDERYNDAVAVEMEGWGFATAVLAHTAVTSLIVRGVSDRATDKSAEQDADWQPAAAANAAAFAVATVLAIVRTPEMRGHKYE